MIIISIKIIPINQISTFTKKQNSSRFYDRNGVLLYIMPLKDGLRREYISLEDIPLVLQKKIIEAEDKNFYHHFGIDLISIFRAAKQNKQAGRIVSGASTITMQLARMIFPRKNKQVTLLQKFYETIIAFILEIKYSKKQILEFYLNNIPFGYQIEGVASATRSFFGITPMELTESQMDVIVKIPRRPSDYAPLKKYTYPLLCPHFIRYVQNDYVTKKKLVPNDLTLSIDSKLCTLVENDIQSKISDYKDARIHNGSALVINNRTGEIIVWVGNGNYYDETNGQIDGVLVRNQPGSSMKPFLYALALEDGFCPTDILPDIPQDFGSSKVYVPLNFNNRYNGPVRMRVALASSLNIPAVYLLFNIGVTNYMNKLLELGFDSLQGERDKTGLSIALGSSEVSLFEMVRAFSVFPRDGTIANVQFLKDSNRLITQKRIFSSDTCRIICDFLCDKSARSMGFGHSNIFDTPYPCIFKTGTSNQFQNIIALGATTEFTAGVWFGNFEGETVIKQTGSSIPLSVVRKTLDYLNNEVIAKPFKKPQKYSKQKICILSGEKPSNFCPSIDMEFIQKTSKEKEQCSWHRISDTGKVIINYPSKYQHWATSKNMNSFFTNDNSELNIIYPTDGALFIFDPSLPLEVQQLCIQAIGGKEQKAELFIDDKYYGYSNSIFEWNIPLEIGEHTITVKCGNETKIVSYTVK